MGLIKRICWITCFCFLFWNPVSLLSQQSTNSVLLQSEYKDACGPISIFVALAKLGYPQKLEDIAKKCNWKSGQRMKFSSIVEVINRCSNLKARAVKLTPDQLRNLYMNGNDSVAILAIRKDSDEINHVTCITDAKEDRFKFTEYPSLAGEFFDSKLVDIWDGETIIVTRKKTESIFTRYFFGAFLGIVCLLLIFASGGLRK